MFSEHEGLDQRIADSFAPIRKAVNTLPDGKGKPIVITFRVMETGRFSFYLLAPNGDMVNWRQAPAIKPATKTSETPEARNARYEFLGECQRSLADFAVQKGWVTNIDEVVSWWVYIRAMPAFGAPFVQ